jgi:hypothetical protein
MTQAELDALPEDGLWSQEDRVVDGRTVRTLVCRTVGSLHTRRNEPTEVTDENGRSWRVGWGEDGIRYKQRRMLTAPESHSTLMT